MGVHELERTAQALVAPGKGILAADESTGTISKRFEGIRLESTDETRRSYRAMLFTAPGIEQYLSGVILFDETFRQHAKEGAAFPELLARRGILPGIKVDRGTVPLSGFPGEKVTEGLDGLGKRLPEYRDGGARFAKWRAVIAIGEGLPSRCCLDANAEALARYAATCQEAGIVPIVEPEVLMTGDHDLRRCESVTTAALRAVFARLIGHRVRLEGILLKPNMVVPGTESARRAGVEEVAEATVRCLRRSVPAAVPGIVFLSGGQSPELATAHLDAINRLGPQPWALSFSFARALQDPVMKAWKGKSANAGMAQRIFAHRAECSSVARQGRYSSQMEARSAA